MDPVGGDVSSGGRHPRPRRASARRWFSGGPWYEPIVDCSRGCSEVRRVSVTGESSAFRSWWRLTCALLLLLSPIRSISGCFWTVRSTGRLQSRPSRMQVAEVV
jgi:hypothetical protein